jgi:hypothetical protein
MKTSTVLKIVKEHLAKYYKDTAYDTRPDHERKLSQYICFAAENAEYRQHISTQDSIRIKTLMKDMLFPYDSLEEWLEEVHHIHEPGLNDSWQEYITYCDKMQITRHAWVDNMIIKFINKGD